MLGFSEVVKFLLDHCAVPVDPRDRYEQQAENFVYLFMSVLKAF